MKEKKTRSLTYGGNMGVKYVNGVWDWSMGIENGNKEWEWSMEMDISPMVAW